MKPTSTIHIQLSLPDEQRSRRSSFDFNAITSILSPNKTRLTANISHGSSVSLDRTRTPRFSTVSSSYAQFLKQRDMDKNKKTVS